MIASLLLTFREGLEAALIIGIILGYLSQTRHADRAGWVWGGVGLASALSLVLAVALYLVGASLEGQAEYIFEGTTMLLAVAVLTWMIFWMRSQARQIKSHLEAELSVAVRRGHHWALFSVAFLAVFREGVETALFLTAAGSNSAPLATVAGGLLGLGAAAVIGWLIYTSTVHLNVRRFFDVTSALLLVFAAGLFAHGIYEFQEAGWIPVIVEHVWDIKPVLDDKSTGGAILRTLVGYNDNPSLLEVLSYIGYWIVVLGLASWWSRRPVSQSAAVSGA